MQLKKTIEAYPLSTKAIYSSSKITPLLIDDVTYSQQKDSKICLAFVYYIKAENNKKAAGGPLGPYWDL